MGVFGNLLGGLIGQGDCAKPFWKGDGSCDDENNTEGCDWDGGDCCGATHKTIWCSVSLPTYIRQKCLCMPSQVFILSILHYTGVRMS